MMNKIRLLLVLAASVLSSLHLVSQTAQPCRWAGSVEATTYYLGRVETVVGTVIYELDITHTTGEIFKLAGGNLTWSASGTWANGECTVQGGPYSFDISIDAGDVGYLNIDNNGNYYGDFTFYELGSVTPALVRTTCQGYTYYQSPVSYQMVIGKQDSTFLQNDFMTGSYAIMQAADFGSSYKWNLHKERPGTKLTVEAAGYDNWMPEAVGEGWNAANVLKFSAMLTEEDETTACAKADSFTFQLINVSREPGVCLNFPRAEVAADNYDLHFQQELNSPDDVMSSDWLTLRTPGGREATATVASYDWGAFGTLKVTAHMQGGKKITGYLKEHPEITEIPIPKRSPDSKIADHWKQDHGVQGLADDDDSESDPVGDGHPGDGFTLYEEYRGFQVNFEHKMGDPKKKDLFIYSESNDFLPGIQLFKAVTGLNVLTGLSEFFEFNKKTRLMNFNYSAAPHSVDQHGLWIKPSGMAGASFTNDLGPPKNVDSVNISLGAYGFRTIMRGTSKEITNELNSTVAHELGHAVHIDHHGERDNKRLWESENVYNKNTKIFDIHFTEDLIRDIFPQWEDGRPFTQILNGVFYVAMWGGEHSGFEDCIMRYDVAYAYQPGPGLGSDIRYMVRENERTGLMLCDKKEDSPGGVNDLNRQPRPRYGSALMGDCIHQICVNDKYH